MLLQAHVSHFYSLFSFYSLSPHTAPQLWIPGACNRIKRKRLSSFISCGTSQYTGNDKSGKGLSWRIGFKVFYRAGKGRYVFFLFPFSTHCAAICCNSSIVTGTRFFGAYRILERLCGRSSVESPLQETYVLCFGVLPMESGTFQGQWGLCHTV